MKRIGVISDTHGNLDAIKACVSEAGKVDAWFHLGDFSADAEELNKITGLPVYSVCGNCDYRSSSPEELTVNIEGVKFLLMHGHKYSVAFDDTLRACLRAEELECDMLLYGHTHIPELSSYGRIQVLNPGSPVRPLGGSKPSFAIVTADNGTVKAQLIPLC